MLIKRWKTNVRYSEYPEEDDENELVHEVFAALDKHCPRFLGELYDSVLPVWLGCAELAGYSRFRGDDQRLPADGRARTAFEGWCREWGIENSVISPYALRSLWNWAHEQVTHGRAPPRRWNLLRVRRSKVSVENRFRPPPDLPPFWPGGRVTEAEWRELVWNQLDLYLQQQKERARACGLRPRAERRGEDRRFALPFREGDEIVFGAFRDPSRTTDSATAPFRLAERAIWLVLVRWKCARPVDIAKSVVSERPDLKRALLDLDSRDPVANLISKHVRQLEKDLRLPPRK